MRVIALLHGGPLDGQWLTVETLYDLRIPLPDGTLAVYYQGEIGGPTHPHSRWRTASYWFKEIQE